MNDRLTKEPAPLVRIRTVPNRIGVRPTDQNKQVVVAETTRLYMV